MLKETIFTNSSTNFTSKTIDERPLHHDLFDKTTTGSDNGTTFPKTFSLACVHNGLKTVFERIYMSNMFSHEI